MDESPAIASHRNLFRVAFLFEGGLIVLALALGWAMSPPVWERIQWSSRDFAWGLAATVPLAVGLLILRKCKSGPLGNLNHVVDRLLVPTFSQWNLLQLAIVSLLAGVGEEMLFRGVLQPVIANWFGAAIGIALTSITFGLVHAITTAYAILAALVGLYFGILAIEFDNLLVPIVAHSLYDLIALVYLTRNVPSAAKHDLS